jgi:hypothetical protein
MLLTVSKVPLARPPLRAPGRALPKDVANWKSNSQPHYGNYQNCSSDGEDEAEVVSPKA